MFLCSAWHVHVPHASINSYKQLHINKKALIPSRTRANHSRGTTLFLVIGYR